MTTITAKLKNAIWDAGFTCETIAPLVGLTGATFSLRKKGRCSWELDKCYGVLDILHIPRTEITECFTGGLDRKPRKLKARMNK